MALTKISWTTMLHVEDHHSNHSIYFKLQIKVGRCAPASLSGAEDEPSQLWLVAPFRAVQGEYVPWQQIHPRSDQASKF